ncbi:MAG: hypothetical protein COU29_00715 [Candidatus Magasanikbacteria bacterium CG10_big_fil_rev_8_21_14_0_10_36_32]|uniref:Uncharacterized protein n=1 Tax=Candidatus Magasanikbacteria bacterium CG10_big_fil_rev_8_21_14_0_10_36_32 TaxID=1974646 RepID=A0A2M6W6B6_9BACT|nr:MAG: hypothetical protein COU29_00715 [Candidatus Magasanikbacteria bacterium CG10_big_fil_rev_8_21_14_0_10_36_32]
MIEKSGFIDQIKNKIFAKEVEPIMIPGEIFDPEKELIDIRQLPHEERKEALEEYKEKLAYQKEGFAEMQVKLIELVRQNSDATFEELNDKALEIGYNFGFTENQQRIIQFILEQYMEKHQQIRELRKSYPDDKELFKAIFGREPKGDLEVIESPIILYFRLHNEVDYTVIRSGAYKDNRGITDEDIKSAIKSRGVNIQQININYNGEQMVLKNIICAEQARGIEFNFDRQATFRHEEQHAIENLLVDTKASDMMPFLKAQNDDERQKTWRGFLQDRCRRFQAYTKDEILAFLRGGNRKLKSIYEQLTCLSEKEGLYDFLTRFGETDREYVTKMPENFQPTALKILEDVYSRDNFNKLIKNGLNAYTRLVKGGYSKEMAINLLSTEPLVKWLTVTKRMLENKK